MSIIIKLCVRSGQGLHAVFGHLDYMVNPDPGMERIAFLGVYQDIMVRVLHSFFSVQVRQ